MGKRGPKTFSEKLFDVVAGYRKITPGFFSFLNEKLEKGTEDEKWKAMAILRGGMEKFIPTVVQGDSDAPLRFILYPQKNESGNDTLETTPETRKLLN